MIYSGLKSQIPGEYPPLVEAVARWHHEEDRSKRTEVEDPNIHRLIDVVQFSNSLIIEMQFGNSGHSKKQVPSPSIMRRLKINEGDLDEFEEKLKNELESEKEHISLLNIK
mgnify:CR=1 FL=1